MRRRLLVTALLVVGLLVWSITAPPADGATPSWRLKFADAFNTPVAKGKLSDCNHNPDTLRAYCDGLSGAVRANWWAYPKGWPDTATQRSYPVGGFYDPASTVWISGGQMHIRMWRAASGPVHSAAVVPKKLMGQKYGRYEERWRVSKAAAGYKSAHLLWPVSNDACPNCEIDFPEGNWTGGVYGFAHHLNSLGGDQDAYDAHTTWTAWHTTVIEWKPGRVTFAIDGRTVGRSTTAVPNTAMSWDIQNETALEGRAPAPHTSAQMDIAYVKGWTWG
ncbi:glycoside hydrolase family 16 protein [Streptomyces sp. MZ04]|uniref:glycoside hydrolase family 16 protein n=1 Tax=Streptomyces sp. MZ04 TaxID=2559236 RepID=UPI00107E7D65|nr:glycoside hydrolase family 16 protein [Streptomyces sp. MZ04]TGB13871.1 glycosyl hydrolase family protein [Streptomyces sp. MZ04]